VAIPSSVRILSLNLKIPRQMQASSYSAAKHAVEGFSASLAVEVAPFGIKVTAVAPGQFRMDFLAEGSVRVSRGQSTAYGESVGVAMAKLEEVNRGQIGDPDRAACAILAVAKADNPSKHLLLGSDALSRARTKNDDMLSEIETWEQWSLSTDFE
jgi:NAD(P)-dependent dehydrogenase (short-subunit alcohol dehydrogenase family)